MMRRTILMILAAAMLLMTMVPGTMAEEKNEWEGLAWLYKNFGENINQQLLDEVHREFRPIEMDCGDVQIVLREVLYDGRWMYTAATAVPTHPDEVILVPYSAATDDPIAGGWGENLRDDPRTFEEAAAAEGKDLLIVLAYPVEFEAEECCFTDHRQDAGVQSTLFSGAEVLHYSGTGKITVQVAVSRISVADGEEISNAVFDFPVEIICPGTEEKAYRTTDEGLPFSRMTLTQTALATYVSAEWADPEDMVLMQLIGPEGEAYPRGNPDDVFSFRMDSFPQSVGVQLEGSEEVYWFSAEE